MSRQALNDRFGRTSFLNGVNAPYIEELHDQYEKNPGSVSDEWRLFFESMRDSRDRTSHDGEHEHHQIERAGREPSWGLPLERLQGAPTELISALTGDYGEVERGLRDKIQAKAFGGGLEITPAASFR